MAEYSGPKGETLFVAIDWWCADPDTFPDSLIGSSFKVINHLKDVKEERLLVLLGALLVESAVDDVLHAALPGFNALQEMREITFSVKTSIVRAMRLFPDRLLRAADIVRKTRNDFAHDLTVDTLHKVPHRVDALRTLFYELRPDSKGTKTEAELFNAVTSMTVTGLALYAERIRLAFRYMRSETFMANFKEDYDLNVAPRWLTKAGDARKLYELLRLGPTEDDLI